MAVPLKFQSVEELQAKIDGYFESCWEVNDTGKKVQTRPYTITGLANYLDTNRQTLLNYEEKEAYFDTIKKAKSRCEQYTEEYLFVGKNTAGGIFNLVNNYGWQNKQSTELTGKDGKDLIPVSQEKKEAINNALEQL
jgi:hypothetical protein